LISRDDILVEVGDKAVPSFVVVSGEVRILRPSSVVETLIVVHRPGEVLGERNMLTGCRALVRA
jgi:CRP-like cAMP-binding protein